MNFASCHKHAFLATCLMAAAAAEAGINEGDAFINNDDFLSVSAFGLAGAPLGFVLARLGLSFLYKAVLCLFALCVLALIVATVLFAGDLAMILVIFAAMLILPGLVFFLLGGWAGFALRVRTAGRAG